MEKRTRNTTLLLAIIIIMFLSLKVFVLSNPTSTQQKPISTQQKQIVNKPAVAEAPKPTEAETLAPTEAEAEASVPAVTETPAVETPAVETPVVKDEDQIAKDNYTEAQQDADNEANKIELTPEDYLAFNEEIFSENFPKYFNVISGASMDIDKNGLSNSTQLLANLESIVDDFHISTKLINNNLAPVSMGDVNSYSVEYAKIMRDQEITLKNLIIRVKSGELEPARTCVNALSEGMVKMANYETTFRQIEKDFNFK